MRRLPYGDQVLWPDHCVQGRGRALHEGLEIDLAILVLRKGVNANVDSYSAFIEADRETSTGLAALLRARGMSRVFICGLATDYCVAFSALDARAAGFETFVIEDACRGDRRQRFPRRRLVENERGRVWRIQSAEILA